MNFRKLYFTLLLLITVSISAFSQTNPVSLDTLMYRTARLSNTHPFEKVYLHFDKPYYAVGDTVWFKAYVTIDNHQQSKLSKIVYVDIINSKDSIAQSLKLQVTGSVAFGNVTLAAPLYKQDNYHFRAYTNWMRNEDPAYFFNKTVAVGNITNPIITNIASLSSSTKSGTAKVTAKIVYKDPMGKPYVNKKVSWKVVNDEETIAKNKGVTNANGVLEINFTTNKLTEMPTAELTTDISVSDDKTVPNAYALTHVMDQPDVQFFPEGGDLVAGIRSRVAVKAVKPDGLGINIKGTVTDNSGATVAEISTQHLGMGLFALQPEVGKTYKANITFPDGSQASYNLPGVHTEGAVISVYNTDPANLTVKITANPAFVQKNQNNQFYILGQNGEVICYAAKRTFQENSYSAVVPKTKFPSGVAKFTLLNDRGEPISERVTFIMRNDMLDLSLKTPQASYAPRQKVAMTVSAMADGKPADANLSVTVIDETKVPYDEGSEITILTNLLLTSELKGYVEKPNYYFNHPTEQTAADLDILMLTQGYRRFSYLNLANNRFPEAKFSPEQGVAITGTLRNSTGLPISKGVLSMLIGTSKSPINTVANSLGEFRFTNLSYPDSTKITVNARNNQNANNLMIILDNTTAQAATPNVNAPDAITNIDSTMNALVQNAKKQAANSHTLDVVNIRSTSLVKKPNHEDYPALSGLAMEADHMIKGDQLSNCANMAACLQYIATAGLTNAENNLYMTRSYQAGDKRPVALYYNGMFVDINFLLNISPEDVESVEVFKDDGLSGINRMNNTNGVVVINPKVKKHVQMSIAEIKAFLAPQYSAQNTLFRGYTASRAFYSPKYDPAKTYGLGSDLRSTVYWNPKVTTDKNGAATLEFYNADGKGSYRAIIEGIDINGNIGRYVYHYNIQ